MVFMSSAPVEYGPPRVVLSQLSLLTFIFQTTPSAGTIERYNGCDERCSANHCSLTTARVVTFTPPGTRIRRMTTTAEHTTRTPLKIIRWVHADSVALPYHLDLAVRVCAVMHYVDINPWAKAWVVQNRSA
jgi:hypothetical protein